MGLYIVHNVPFAGGIGQNGARGADGQQGPTGPAGPTTLTQVLQNGQSTGPVRSVWNFNGPEWALTDDPNAEQLGLQIIPRFLEVNNSDLKVSIAASTLKTGTTYTVVRGNGIDVALHAISPESFQTTAYRLNSDGTATAGTYDPETDIFTAGGVGGIGQQGPPGEPGQIGPSIQNPQIDQNGDLTVDLYLEGGTFSSTLNLGRVVAPPGEPGQDFEWKDIDDTTFYGYWQNGALTPSLYYAVTVNNQFTVLVHPKNVSGQFQPAIKYDLSNDYSYGIYDIDSRTFAAQGGPEIPVVTAAQYLAGNYGRTTPGWVRLAANADDGVPPSVYFYSGGSYFTAFHEETGAFTVLNKNAVGGQVQYSKPYITEVYFENQGSGEGIGAISNTQGSDDLGKNAFVGLKSLTSPSPNLGISSTTTEIAFTPNQYIAGKAFINISGVPAGTDIDLFWYLTALAGNSRPSSLEFRWQGPADGLNGNNSWVTNSQAVLQLIMKTTIPVAPGMAEQVLCEPFELGPIGPTAHALIDLTQALRTFVHPTGGSQTVRKTYTVFNGGTASQSYLCLRIVQPSTVPGTQIICLVRGVF